MADSAIQAESSNPQGELTTRTMAMPSDTNQNGDIFGGWLVGQMDIAGAIFSSKVAKGRTVTVAIDGMSFRKPVYVGDVISVYVSLVHMGSTSVALGIEAWVTRKQETDPILVTKGNFTYVAIDDQGHPIKVER